jgi:hypothetical protein
VLHTDDRLVTTGDTCAGGQPVKLSRRMSTLACADGARATAAAVIAARNTRLTQSHCHSPRFIAPGPSG